MSRRPANLELSIRGDELEQHRIQLEHNLQHTDLSLHLSSTPDEDISDVEIPRHNIASITNDALASFEQRSGDQFDPNGDSQYQTWDYYNQDESVNPYGGETISTAAHHASALTLSAGLAEGRAAAKRDVSLSGAEYDPDRPLQGIVAGIQSRFEKLGMDPRKIQQTNLEAINFSPLIVDDTVELDHILSTGRASIPASGFRSPPSSFASSTTSTSESVSPRPGSPASRPKLSDALQAVAFSPKRPRSAQGHVARQAPRRGFPTSQPERAHEAPRKPSPPPASVQSDRTQSGRRAQYSSTRHQQSLSYAQLEHEATGELLPSDTNGSSKFTRMAHGLAQEIEAEQSLWEEQQTGQLQPHESKRKTKVDIARVRQSRERNPFQDVENHARHTNAAPRARIRTPAKGAIHLPDVTGLTSAIDSPARMTYEYYHYNGKDGGEKQARIIATLNAVQSKLAFLETENSISRRRVHELELELESCKDEVARERTRVLQREERIAQHAADVIEKEKERLANLNKQVNRKSKSQTQKDAEMESKDRAAAESRYREAVEEKKALEALIEALRTHLSRLTAELAEHQSLLQELRSLRDSDARALTEKSNDVDKLRQEVERLAGEVEVLRGVVEEGLKERRNARLQHSRDISQLSVAPLVPHNDPVHEGRNDESFPNIAQDMYGSPSGPDVSDGSSISSRLRSPTPSPRRRTHGTRHTTSATTIRTDQATVSSSQPVGEFSARPYVSGAELDRISIEVQERRSERSSLSTLSHSKAPSLSDSYSHVLSRSASRHGNIDEEDECVAGAPFQPPTRTSTPVSLPRAVTPPRAVAPARFHVPTPGHALKKARVQIDKELPSKDAPVAPHPQPPLELHLGTAAEAPFPRIRGTHMERLFFSKQEHNSQTCTVCRRRRRNHRVPPTQGIESWLEDARTDAVDGEPYNKGASNVEAIANAHENDRKRQTGDQLHGERDKLPSQTVLTRVIRELEDDFTHYKSIYIELAEQYKLMDAASNVAKRNVVAGHLKEVIDILEQKGDQIASLYDLLTFKDKPTDRSVELN
ncbi:hypothetical protein WOLCODRAFT_162258 [Wolfiporia cocos MD-104 SS10]|uniref:Cep57 centrosome microtubule-binding domain-containing protein n=1 Tax=Wolfiporia cocos (strain MD-104) TaxID=742152 RepID=A0A2H3JKC7_WOLCO|nr:hypothetical protein WOLCODRAFT_162258 [Wolfiporia cocos MD-104 SS10]